jgi:cyclopropane-fatty-acyl-phospholipid synthase
MLFTRTLSHQIENWVADSRKRRQLPLRIKLWDGSTYDLADFDTPAVTLTVREAGALPYLMAASLDSLGEAYVKQKIDLDGSLDAIISLAYELAGSTTEHRALARVVRHFKHDKERDRAAIQYHYDVSNAFYQLWLDQRMVYSCAYFEQGDEDLDTAQLKKIDHILRKIQLQPGQRLLDIGCGWGALVIRAAQAFGAHCVGVTLSREQFELASARVAAAGLSDRIEIRLQDYREVTGSFDRITSVGMFEHVGRKNLPDYFSRINRLLDDDGVALNHGITSTDPDSGDTALGASDFIDRYVFPQGELPHIALVLDSMQRGGLEALDVENLRRHYARTLHSWASRYEAQSAQVRALVDEQTYRIWRVYLAGCAYAFERDDISLFQVVCRKARRPAQTLPWSRRYMYE